MCALCVHVNNINVSKLYTTYTRHQFVVLFCSDKRDAESRLASAQRALLMQEDVLRDSERDRKQLIEKVSALERNMSVCEANNAKIQVRSYCVFTTVISEVGYLAAFHLSISRSYQKRS